MDTIRGMLQKLWYADKLERNTSCYEGQEERHVPYTTMLAVSFSNRGWKDAQRAGSATLQRVFRDVI